VPSVRTQKIFRIGFLFFHNEQALNTCGRGREAVMLQRRVD
jgi:hypothetical protein